MNAVTFYDAVFNKSLQQFSLQPI